MSSLGLVAPAPVGAHPNVPNPGCNDDTLNFVFVNYPNSWQVSTIFGPYDYRTDWLHGAGLWDQIKSPTGSTWTSSGIGNSDQVSRIPLSGNILGDAYCSPVAEDYFTINTTVPIGPMVRALAAHEAGHAHNLLHAGRNDALGNLAPAMATCVLNPSTNEINDPSANRMHGVTRAMTVWDFAGDVTADDYAYLSRVHQNYNTVTPNQSFENGTKFWKSGNALVSLVNSGGIDGPAYVTVAKSNPAGANSVLSTWIRQQLMPNLNGRVNYKVPAGTTGSIHIEARARAINFEDGNCDPDQYEGGFSYNKENFTGSWSVVKSIDVSPNSSWDYMDLGTPTLATNGWRAADVQLVITNNTTGTVSIDNARVYND